MAKDREVTIPITEGEVEILYRRSSTHPVEYAIMLHINQSGRWQTAFSADNSHRDRHVEDHHCHRYVDGEQQQAEPLPFAVKSTNEAMGNILDWFRRDWRRLL